ncbi:succinate dehydrogenase/fumarate reductase-like Fe-S protein [Duganella sp. 1224]|nr:succinate dehydrogenase/fumarate reductase-like Fe-S protein [Duganella sp. 1224]
MTVTLQIYRYDPDQDAAPRMQTYSIDGHRGTMVLDLITHIKNEIDDSLSCRRSCREGYAVAIA